MRSWLLFGGAGKGCGGLILQRALQQRRPLVALVRNADRAAALHQQGVSVVQGDACEPAAVQQACMLAGSEALIISTMGGGEEYQAHRTVIDCAEQVGLSRMILLTSLGCGNSWPCMSVRVKAAIGPALRQKSLAEVWLQTSKLSYCIIRPGGLLNGEATGKAQLVQQSVSLVNEVNQQTVNQPIVNKPYAEALAVRGLVNRADVAHIVYQLACNEVLPDQIYSLVQPDLQRAG